MDKVSKFFLIKPHSKFGFILFDYLNNKSYTLDNNLQDYFNGVIEKNKLSKIGGKTKIEKLISKNSGFWGEFNNKESLIYHLSGYNYPFLEYEDPKAFAIDDFMMKKYGLKRNLPTPVKVYDVKKIDLIKGEDFPKISVSDISKNNKIINNQDGIIKFGKFTYSSFVNTHPNKNQNKIIRRTVPSGGCKHPTEIYIIFPKNSFYGAGVYHYDSFTHKLDVISEIDIWDKFIKASNYSFRPDAKFAVVYTSIVERAMYRYRDVRSTRAIFGDLGHIIQNTKYIGQGLGFTSITEIKNNEDELKKILGIKNTIEPVLATQAFYE